MKRILSLILALALAVPLFAKPVSVNAVQPLQTKDGRNFCTAFSINQAKKLWATAAHCVYNWTEQDGAQVPNLTAFYIQGKPAHVVVMWIDRDIAVVKAEVGAPSIALAKVAPTVGEDIWSVGYMAGWVTPSLFTGKVANVKVFTYSNEYMILDLRVAGGDSGSPVMNANNEVVSIVQVLYTNAPGVSGGAPWDIMFESLRPFAR